MRGVPDSFHSFIQDFVQVRSSAHGIGSSIDVAKEQGNVGLCLEEITPVGRQTGAMVSP